VKLIIEVLQLDILIGVTESIIVQKNWSSVVIFTFATVLSSSLVKNLIDLYESCLSFILKN
jgi:hypothetical protein